MRSMTRPLTTTHTPVRAVTVAPRAATVQPMSPLKAFGILCLVVLAVIFFPITICVLIIYLAIQVRRTIHGKVSDFRKDPSSVILPSNDPYSFNTWYLERIGRLHPVVQMALWAFGGFAFFPVTWLLWRSEKTGKISRETHSVIWVVLGIASLSLAWMMHRASVREREIGIITEALDRKGL